VHRVKYYRFIVYEIWLLNVNYINEYYMSTSYDGIFVYVYMKWID
jgi:hypothetical protein